MLTRAAVALTVGVAVPLVAPGPLGSQEPPKADEARIRVERGSLYVRTIGRGPPLVILHGGPDFDQAYLLPEMDQLADSFRLIYYDQRGRGKSADSVRAEDVTLGSELEDLERVRRHAGMDAVALLGHSFGTVLALEYALRYPARVSHLILMNPAPVSVGQVTLLRTSYLAQLGGDMDRQRAIMATSAYRQGDPATVSARYRIHFRHALHRAADYEKLMTRMAAQFERQRSDGILKAWAVEERLYQDTWAKPGYDLLPLLRGLRIPTLVIVGEDDFIPVGVASEIAQAIRGAKLATLSRCGHFAYLECMRDVRPVLAEFFRQSP